MFLVECVSVNIALYMYLSDLFILGLIYSVPLLAFKRHSSDLQCNGGKLLKCIVELETGLGVEIILQLLSRVQMQLYLF